MRCARCGKNFDEEMYSGICPKCGHFNNRQKDYDVSKYFSATFDDGGKVTTSAQASKQHEQLHRTYDSSNMHKPGAGQHEKLHQMYDKYNMHKQAGTSPSGSAQARNYQAGVPLGKTNPYQQATVQGSTYQTGQTGSYGQGNAGKGYQGGQSASYGQSGYSGQNKARQASLNGEVKTKNLVTPICILIAVVAVAVTVISLQMKKQSLTERYNTLDYEQEYAEAGEVFEINNRLLLVDKAEVIDTSEYPDLAAEEKLVAVTVEILPADEGNQERKDMSGTVYVSDGYNCKEYLDSYVVTDFLGVEDVLTGYDYLSYSSVDGVTGRFYFFVNYEADDIMISFDEERAEDTMFILERRVSVPLQLEEDMP